ncbi:hypothetical protein vBBaMIFTN5_51 [Bordetella phage vB_BaM-IFTN5]|nr:hypothetical protein vBBaMIFTN4_48 [Bordetella phage vB_BaM-IFTN4]UOK17315.1 hypothetical protein vBBaMIFTN5_51 [Bordetella phage vB_BaM-IFTN5]UOK17519.1 hypothetical protein vBBaMIFTN8_54 [Bordetella phage vB_BaM-IFTN8]
MHGVNNSKTLLFGSSKTLLDICERRKKPRSKAGRSALAHYLANDIPASFNVSIALRIPSFAPGAFMAVFTFFKQAAAFGPQESPLMVLAA